MNILYLKDSFDPSYDGRDEVQITLYALKHGHKASFATSNFNLNFMEDLKNLKLEEIYEKRW